MIFRNCHFRYCLLLLLCFFLVGGKGKVMEGSHQLFRLAFSASVFSDLNESDLRAAMKVWFNTVAVDLNVPLDSNIYIHSTVTSLVEFCRTNAVDGVALTTPELAVFKEAFPVDQVIVGLTDGTLGEEYVLLVHHNSGIVALEQLKGVDVNILAGPRMSLALTWLDVVLMEKEIEPSASLFGSLTVKSKVSDVVLPVFFDPGKACLVPRASFNVMAELNPQLKKQLGVLAISPEIIPVVFAFRSDIDTPVLPRLLEAINRLDQSAAGLQILTLSQSNLMQCYPVSILDESLALLARHKRLLGMRNGSRPPRVSAIPESDRLVEVK